MTLVFFDLETAGLEPAHPITQLAAVAYREWREVDHCNILLQFDEGQADQQALELNRYDRDRWTRDAVPLKTGLRNFCQWLEPYKTLRQVSKRTGRPYMVARLAGHNAATFDAPRLQDACRAHDIFLPADLRVLDTMQLALWRAVSRGVEPPSFKLAELCRCYDIPLDQAHDALADVRATAELAKRLLLGTAKGAIHARTHRN